MRCLEIFRRKKEGWGLQNPIENFENFIIIWKVPSLPKCLEKFHQALHFKPPPPTPSYTCSGATKAMAGIAASARSVDATRTPEGNRNTEASREEKWVGLVCREEPRAL